MGQGKLVTHWSTTGVPQMFPGASRSLLSLTLQVPGCWEALGQQDLCSSIGLRPPWNPLSSALL